MVTVVVYGCVLLVSIGGWSGVVVGKEHGKGWKKCYTLVQRGAGSRIDT